MTQIPSLPAPPQSTDPANFDQRADAFLVALGPFAAAANAQAAENNQAAAAAAASQAAAAGSAASAKTSSDLAVAAASAGRFDAQATYAVGNLAWSPVSGLIYRRLVAGKTATDPSADRINWVEIANLPVGSDPNQVPAVQFLGALAFADVVGSTVVRRSPLDSRPGDVWREYVNDTTTTIKFHGYDGVVRSRTENWT